MVSYRMFQPASEKKYIAPPARINPSVFKNIEANIAPKLDSLESTERKNKISSKIDDLESISLNKKITNRATRLAMSPCMLKELWLYALNPSGMSLSSESIKVLHKFAIAHGLPAEYLFKGNSAFTKDTSNPAWEYAEKLFLDWLQYWIQLQIKFSMAKTRFHATKKRKKTWTLWDRLKWEEEEEPYIKPQIKAPEICWF